MAEYTDLIRVISRVIVVKLCDMLNTSDSGSTKNLGGWTWKPPFTGSCSHETPMVPSSQQLRRCFAHFLQARLSPQPNRSLEAPCIPPPKKKALYPHIPGCQSQSTSSMTDYTPRDLGREEEQEVTERRERGEVGGGRRGRRVGESN